MYKQFFKRLSDLMISSIAMIILTPIFLSVALILTFANEGSPFFFQTRPGKNEKIFRIIKFKTMNDKKDINGKLLPDSERLTHIGRFIRKTSIDEIPQLLNVIKGDMSLIGPRPLLTDYLDLYDEKQKRRHEVRPGITGWAQVNGRNAISWQEKFDLDVWYVDNLSFATDMRILMQTFSKVIKSEGISSSTSVTMERFQGNK